VKKNLANSNYEWVDVHVSGQTVTLFGVETTEDAIIVKSLARAALANTWLKPLRVSSIVRAQLGYVENKRNQKSVNPVVENRNEPGPVKSLEISWPTLEASLNDNTLVLDGIVKSRLDRYELISLVPDNIQVIDRLKITKKPLQRSALFSNQRLIASISMCENGTAKSENGLISFECSAHLGVIETIESTLSKKLTVGELESVVLTPIPFLCHEELQRILIENTLPFESNSAELEPESSEVLNTLADIAKNCDYALSIDGHTDLTGDSKMNMILSLARAKTVKHALTVRGVEEQLLFVKGFGESRPIVNGDSIQAHTRNRRIEINPYLGGH